MEPFFRFMPLPSAGHAAHRTEILINAFAEAVFTAGSNGLTWISGDQNRYPVPIQLIEDPPKIGCGRYVAFRIDEP